MKYLIIILTFISFTINKPILTVAEIEYLESKREDSINISWQGEYYLFRTISNSKYSKKKVVRSISNVEQGDIDFNPKNSKTEILYKDYTKNEMYSKDLIGFKLFTIKDSINIINWEIKNKKKEILGYTCTLAESSFRGRIYQVWFTTQLIAGGPWKLDGLPGMILKADSKDGYCSFEATKIKISKQEDNTIDTTNPYLQEKKFYSWTEFKKKYKEKAIKMSKYNPGSSIIMVAPRLRRERYIEKKDTDYLFESDLKKSID